MKVLKATVKYAAGAKVINGQINVVATLTDGGDIKVWADAGDPELTALRKGQEIDVFCHKGNWYLKPQTSDPPPEPHPSPEIKEVKSSEDVRGFLAVYNALCKETVLSGVSPDTLAQVALHLFLAGKGDI